MLVLIKEGVWIDSTTVLSVHQHEGHVDIATVLSVIKIDEVTAADVAMVLNISSFGPRGGEGREGTSEVDLDQAEPEDMRPKMSSTDYDHMVADQHKDGWDAALEEIYRRIAPSRAGTQTRGLTYDEIIKFLEEQIPEKVAAIDGDWGDSKASESSVLQEDSRGLKQALSGIEVPVQKVAGPTTPPDATLVYADNGVKVSQLQIERRALDALVTQANDGANISNYAMSRRLMQLLGIEVL